MSRDLSAALTKNTGIAELVQESHQQTIAKPTTNSNSISPGKGKTDFQCFYIILFKMLISNKKL